MTTKRIITIVFILLLLDFGRMLAVGLISSTLTRPERHIVVIDTDGAGGQAASDTRIPLEATQAPTPVQNDLEVNYGLSSGISGSYPEPIQRWGIWITKYGNQYSIDPNIIAAVMVQESGGDPNATSVAGARGLMQVMPFHGCSTYNPEKNILCGVDLLATFRQKAPDWSSALAAYNAGERGRDNGKGWGYAEKVLAIYERNNDNKN